MENWDKWILPTTLFTTGYIVWLLGIIFAGKSSRAIVYTIGGALASIGVLLLFKENYVSTASIFICLVGLTLIFAYGFDIPFSQPQAKGPLAEFMGKKGVCATCLEPKGTVEIEGKTLSASTEGLFVNKGEEVKVIRTAEKMVIVEKATPSS